MRSEAEHDLAAVLRRHTGMTTTLTQPAVPSVPQPDEPAPARKRPRWTLPALVVLLAGTALLYLWDLSASGWANSFYSAAAQAGSQSWKAWFFGSSDAANSITVDKTPAALWVTGLSVRVFGLSSWSILVPQALEGVATVGLLYATVKRWFGPAAGLLASPRSGCCRPSPTSCSSPCYGPWAAPRRRTSWLC